MPPAGFYGGVPGGSGRALTGRWRGCGLFVGRVGQVEEAVWASDVVLVEVSVMARSSHGEFKSCREYEGEARAKSRV